MLFALVCSLVSWTVWTVGLIVTAGVAAGVVTYFRNPQFRQQMGMIFTVGRALWPMLAAAAKNMMQTTTTQQCAPFLFNKAIYVHIGGMWENVTQKLNRAYADESESWPPAMTTKGGAFIGQREDGAMYYYANQLPPLSDVLSNDFLVTDEQRKKEIMAQFFPIFGPPLDDDDSGESCSDDDDDDDTKVMPPLVESKHAC